MKFRNLSDAIFSLRYQMYFKGEIVKTQDWQGKQDNFKFIELLNVHFETDMPNSEQSLIQQTNPDIEWAREHFYERVSGQPLNPPPSHKKWLTKTNEYFSDCDDNEKFSHSYPERFWPKSLMKNGIRFETGDLNDLIVLLKNNPSTRQAYLPIYFPEDLGASKLNERVPCTLGYHIIIRNNKLHMFYPMRSCDIIRHFKNDMYLTVKLAQYIRDNVDKNLEMGKLNFFCTSLHCFENDRYYLKKWLEKNGVKI